MTSNEKLLAKRGLGRPRTGINPTMGVRMPSDEITAVDVWRGQQDDRPSRPMAIRRLVKLGLRSREGTGGSDEPIQPKKKKGLTGMMEKR